MENEVMKFIQEFSQLPSVENATNVLCVLPHPDDGELGLGATVAKLKSRGARVTYLLVTSGGAGIRGRNREEAKKIRKSEQEEAAKILGIDQVIYLDYPDAGDYTVESVKKDVEKYLEKISPDFVFTVDPLLPYEFHPDHKKCGTAVAEAVLFKGDESLTLGFFFTAHPNQFVCFGKRELDLKFKAMAAHRSQFQYENMKIYKKYFKLKAMENGRKAGCEYAESFKVLKPYMLHVFEEALYV